jgi:hypothetical protein
MRFAERVTQRQSGVERAKRGCVGARVPRQTGAKGSVHNPFRPESLTRAPGRRRGVEIELCRMLGTASMPLGLLSIGLTPARSAASMRCWISMMRQRPSNAATAEAFGADPRWKDTDVQSSQQRRSTLSRSTRWCRKRMACPSIIGDTTDSPCGRISGSMRMEKSGLLRARQLRPPKAPKLRKVDP